MGVTPLDTLKAMRSTFPSPMSNDQLGQLLNAVAWAHRAEGYGLLKKPSGGNCRQPQTGTLISRDILMLTDGRIFDVLIDADHAAAPTWGSKAPLDPARFVAPVEATIALPPPVIVPPAPPRPDFPQRYPDESPGGWWDQTLGEIGALFDRKGEAFNLGMFKWSARIAYDIGAGMEKERAKATHVAELKRALGL